jgi:DnaK suppressor protein
VKKTLNRIVNLPMNVLTPVKRVLLREEKRLEKEKKSLEKRDPFKDESRVDDNTNDSDAREIIDHEQNVTLVGQIDRALIEVKKSLSRIKLGSYGVCEDCGKMIDTDRLRAKPTVSKCIECERKAEK